MNNYGGLQGYDVEKNSLIPPMEIVHGADLFVCKDDGQLISYKEVINFNKGDIIITLGIWNNEERDVCYKAIIISDNVAKSDLEEFLKERNNGTVEV